MELVGTITENLRSALASAGRLRGHPVYADTLSYWRELVHEARRRRALTAETDLIALDALVARLEAELAERG